MESADDRILGEGDEGITKLPSKLFGAFAIFLTVGFGVALGGFVSYDRMVDQRAKGLVFGEVADFGNINLTETSSEPVSDDFSAPVIVPPDLADQIPYVTPLVEIPAPQSALNPCKPAFDKLSSAKASAESEFNDSTISAKSTFDQEQKTYSAQLTDLSRQRVAAINNYLGQIAIATSKYNQSTDSDAYEVYKQEQGEAFEAYSQAINKIGPGESKVSQQKKQSEDKYNQAITAAQNKLNQDLAKIQADYASETSGKNCN